MGRRETMIERYGEDYWKNIVPKKWAVNRDRNVGFAAMDNKKLIEVSSKGGKHGKAKEIKEEVIKSVVAGEEGLEGIQPVDKGQRLD